MGMALCLWMGNGHVGMTQLTFQISNLEEYQCYQLVLPVQCQTRWSLRWRDLWPLCYINRCYRSVPKEVFICDELKVKKICFQTPCWCLTVLQPSTTHHSILKTEKPEVSPPSPGFIESLWSSGPDPGSQKSKRNSEGNRWDRRRCNPDSEDANARLDCGRHQGCVWPQGGNVQ